MSEQKARESSLSNGQGKDREVVTKQLIEDKRQSTVSAYMHQESDGLSHRKRSYLEALAMGVNTKKRQQLDSHGGRTIEQIDEAERKDAGSGNDQEEIQNVNEFLTNDNQFTIQMRLESKDTRDLNRTHYPVHNVNESIDASNNSRKQSVLIKKAKVGRASDLDTYGHGADDEVGVNGNVQIGGIHSKRPVDALLDSNLVQAGTEESKSDQQRFRSTMYITSDSRKFALKGTQMDNLDGSLGSGMIINLGEKTYTQGFIHGEATVNSPSQSNYGNKANHEVLKNHVIGGADLTALQHTNFKPRLRPKQNSNSPSNNAQVAAAASVGRSSGLAMQDQKSADGQGDRSQSKKKLLQAFEQQDQPNLFISSYATAQKPKHNISKGQSPRQTRKNSPTDRSGFNEKGSSANMEDNDLSHVMNAYGNSKSKSPSNKQGIVTVRSKSPESRLSPQHQEQHLSYQQLQYQQQQAQAIAQRTPNTIQLTTIDPRSMIPSRHPSVSPNKGIVSPRGHRDMVGKRQKGNPLANSPQTRKLKATQQKSPRDPIQISPITTASGVPPSSQIHGLHTTTLAGSPKYPNHPQQDLKQFHQRQKQQYEKYQSQRNSHLTKKSPQGKHASPPAYQQYHQQMRPDELVVQHEPFTCNRDEQSSSLINYLQRQQLNQQSQSTLFNANASEAGDQPAQIINIQVQQAMQARDQMGSHIPIKNVSPFDNKQTQNSINKDNQHSSAFAYMPKGPFNAENNVVADSVVWDPKSEARQNSQGNSDAFRFNKNESVQSIVNRESQKSVVQNYPPVNKMQSLSKSKNYEQQPIVGGSGPQTKGGADLTAGPHAVIGGAHTIAKELEGTPTMTQNVEICVQSSLDMGELIMKRDVAGNTIESKGTIEDPNNIMTSMPPSAVPSMKIGLTIPTPKINQQTTDNFRNTGKASPMGSTAKMISTYTGSNNMKLKIIDQSVIKGTMTSSSLNSNISKAKTQQMLWQLQQNVVGGQFQPQPGQTLQNSEEMLTHFRQLKQILMQDEVTTKMQEATKSDGFNEEPDEKYPDNYSQDKISQDNLLKTFSQGLASDNDAFGPPQQTPMNEDTIKDVIDQSSAMNQIESYRSMLRQNSQANELLLQVNQENFKSLISPEVTRKSYSIMKSDPSQKNLNFGNTQNQKKYSVREDMLHTVTRNFLQEQIENVAQGSKTTVNTTKGRHSKPTHLESKELKEQLQRRLLNMRTMDHTMGNKFNTHIGSASERKRVHHQVDETQSQENELFMTLVNIQNSPKDKAKGTLTKPLTMRNGSLMIDTDDTVFHGTKSDQSQILSPNQVLQHMQQTQFEIAQLSEVAGSRSSQMPSSARRVESTEKFKVVKLKQQQSAVMPSRNIISIRNEASQRTLLQSDTNSVNSLKPVSRYATEHPVVIFIDGSELSETSPCIVLDMNATMRKFSTMKQGSKEADTTERDDMLAQIEHFKLAVKDILDQCSHRLYRLEDLSIEQRKNLRNGPPRYFNRLYTIYGKQITTMLDIEENINMLVCGDKNEPFMGLKTNELFDLNMTAKGFIDKVLTQTNVGIDKHRSTSISKRNTFASRNTLNNSMSAVTGGGVNKRNMTLQLKTMDSIGSMQGTQHSLRTHTKQKLNSTRHKSMTSQEIVNTSRIEQTKNVFKDALANFRLKKQLTSNPDTFLTDNVDLKLKKQAQLDLFTDGIKRGKLPPLQTPNQLEHFVFANSATNDGRTTKPKDFVASIKSLQKINSDISGFPKGQQKDSLKLDDSTLEVAKFALKEKMPTYIDNKLAATVKHDDPMGESYQMVKSKGGETQMNMLSNSLQQRQEWRKKYDLGDKELYQVFSEFTALMMINRQEENDRNPHSVTAKLKKMKQRQNSSRKSEDYLDDLFPIGEKISSLQYTRMIQKDAHKAFQLKDSDLKDFRVPIQVVIESSETLKRCKKKLRAHVLGACGIPAAFNGVKVSYEQYLFLNSMLKFKKGTEEEYAVFFVKIFDPGFSGSTAVDDFEVKIDLMFGSEGENNAPGKQSQMGATQMSKKEMGQTGMTEADSLNDRIQVPQSTTGSLEKKPTLAERKQSVVSKQSLKTTKTSGFGATSKSKLGVEPDEKDESVSANIKRICREKGVYKADGFIDPYVLANLFRTRQLEMDDFKQALC